MSINSMLVWDFILLHQRIGWRENLQESATMDFPKIWRGSVNFPLDQSIDIKIFPNPSTCHLDISISTSGFKDSQMSKARAFRALRVFGLKQAGFANKNCWIHHMSKRRNGVVCHHNIYIYNIYIYSYQLGMIKPKLLSSLMYLYLIKSKTTIYYIVKPKYI